MATITVHRNSEIGPDLATATERLRARLMRYPEFQVEATPAGFSVTADTEDRHLRFRIEEEIATEFEGEQGDDWAAPLDWFDLT
jgi:hypothetical protein